MTAAAIFLMVPPANSQSDLTTYVADATLVRFWLVCTVLMLLNCCNACVPGRRNHPSTTWLAVCEKDAAFSRCVAVTLQ